MKLLGSESSTSLDGASMMELEGGGEDGVIGNLVTTDVSLNDCSVVVATNEDIGIRNSRMGMKVHIFHCLVL